MSAPETPACGGFVRPGPAYVVGSEPLVDVFPPPTFEEWMEIRRVARIVAERIRGEVKP